MSTIATEKGAIASTIENIDREYQALNNYDAPLKNKVAFYKDANKKINALEARITKLESNIKSVKSAEARAEADAKNQADAEKTAAEAAEKTAAGKEAAAEARKANYHLVERAELEFNLDLEDLREQALDWDIDKAWIMKALKRRWIDKVKSKADIIADRVATFEGGIDYSGDIRDGINNGAGIEDFKELRNQPFYRYLTQAIKKGG